MSATNKELRTAFLAGWAARNKRPSVEPAKAFQEWNTGAYDFPIPRHKLPKKDPTLSRGGVPIDENFWGNK